MATGGYVRVTLGPLQEALRVALSLSDNQVALLQGPALGLPIVIAAIPLGVIIDRYSRARLLMWLAALNLIGSAATALAPNFLWLLAARCLVGLSGLATIPVVMSLLADLYEPALRGRVTMAVSIGQTVGNSVAFALGGMVLTAFGSEPTAWRESMLWLTVPLLPILFLMLAGREPPRLERTVILPSASAVVSSLWNYRAVLGPTLLGIVMMEIAIGGVLTWAAPMFARVHSWPPNRIGTTMAAALLVSGLIGPALGGLVADFSQRTGGPRRTITWLSGLALMGTPTGLFAVAPEPLSASVLLSLFLTVTLAVAVMGMTLFTVVIPNEIRGLCMSLLVAINILFALAFAPVIVSTLSGLLGGGAAIGKALTIVCVTTGILGAGVFAFGRRFLGGTT